MINPDAIWTYRARLERVIDGDTYYMVVDHGMSIWSRQSLRLQGLDTWELAQPEGNAAKLAAHDWFVEHAHGIDNFTSWPYYIQTEKDHITFNRYVASIQCSQGHNLATFLEPYKKIP